MRFGVAVASGIFSVLAVALLVQFVPWAKFAWLDEAIFVGYLMTGQVALAPVAGMVPLMAVGAGAALLAWRWEMGARRGTALGRGVLTGLVLYLVGVSITNPFLSMFRSHMGDMPASVARMMSSPGWIALVESLLGHLFFGLVLGLFLTMAERWTDGRARSEA